MSDDADVTFGEKLLGMQGFSAARAQRYRGELEKLLVDRLSTFQRWMIGMEGGFVGGALVLGGIAMASITPRSAFAGFDEARLTVAMCCVLTGVLFGGWLVRIALQGGYGRRLGDKMGVVIAVVFCGGWAAAFIEMAWYTEDAVLRMKLFSAGVLIFAVLAGCLVMTLLQRMHRETQEKLLRIEYHLAELREGCGGGGG